MAVPKRILMVTMLLASCASAAPLCTQAVANAADFAALTNIGCQFGDKIFYNFTYSYAPGGGTPVVAASVAVQFSNLGNLANQPVVSFIANWDVIDGQQGDIRINYSVLAPVSAAMYNSSLTLSGFLTDIDLDLFPAYISGAESVCCPGPPTNTAKALGVILSPPLTEIGLQFQTGIDLVAFTPATQISITKDIFLNAGSPGNEALLTRIDQGLTELSAVPEPLSFFLFGSGLIALVVLMKRMGKFNKRRVS